MRSKSHTHRWLRLTKTTQREQHPLVRPWSHTLAQNKEKDQRIENLIRTHSDPVYGLVEWCATVDVFVSSDLSVVCDESLLLEVV